MTFLAQRFSQLFSCCTTDPLAIISPPMLNMPEQVTFAGMYLQICTDRFHHATYQLSNTVLRDNDWDSGNSNHHGSCPVFV